MGCLRCVGEIEVCFRLVQIVGFRDSCEVIDDGDPDTLYLAV